MDLPHLIDALSSPTAYPHAVERVEVRQTHLSVVFLTGSLAYKVRKPVQFDFVDFSTLERRLHDCREEVRLNARLAPDVYLGVLPICRDGDGARVGGTGEAIEHAVQMRQLPEEATLLSYLQRDELGAAALEALARRLAGLHAGARRDEHIASFGRFDVVADNARGNLGPSREQVGATLSPNVFARLAELLEARLVELRAAIEARAARGVPCDTHGDLRLEHVYLFPERPAPGDLVVIDCIEFNERFRFADPVADMAFLVMDLLFHGRADLATTFATAYFEATGDFEGQQLLPFYTAYRAAVRAKVEGLERADREATEAAREAARERSDAHWLLALGQLETAGQRPCVALLAGLPGSGKSTLARALAERAGFAVLRSDVVRKELAGANPPSDVYSPEWSERTYRECWRRAEDVLRQGGRVLVDANFRQEERRQQFVQAAVRRGVTVVLLVCRASPEVARQRLHHRQGDVSDAGWGFYRQAAREWEEPGPKTRLFLREVDANGSPEEVLAGALAVLRERGLL